MGKKETDIKQTSMVSFDEVRDRIVSLRGQQVILDYAVAELYGVETREINQAVKNNPRKFPEGWMFELDNQESAALRSKNLILEKTGKGKSFALRNNRINHEKNKTRYEL